MKIDAHHHFWKYSKEQYGWISDDMAALRRDFLPGDLGAEIASAGVDGVVSVQARQTLEETGWLLSLAQENDFIQGVVGWVPLVDPDVEELLSAFDASPKMKAVRHVVQDEPDDNFLLREDFNRGIEMVGRLGLVYDILIFERHLPQAIQFVDRHPGQAFVLDHIAKPRIRDGIMEPWAGNIRSLAERPNVCCKLSGLVTEADFGQWTEQQLRPYMDVVLEAFGPERLMFGSDWPVCLAACEYRRWLTIVADFVAEFSEDERAAVLGDTAVRAYGL